jgi:hypothetical protein
VEADTLRWPENTKNHLEDALFKFLEQANLLQYYSAFIEQGLSLYPLEKNNICDKSLGGDDLKQLAEAQNDDFQEIITLVGMVSKPLHVKRFKKALAAINNSHSTPTEETLPDRHLSPPLIHPSSANHSPKMINQISSNWCLNNTHQLLDDNQRKMIADEAERLANLLPITTIKKPNGRNHISKDLFVSFMKIC